MVVVAAVRDIGTDLRQYIASSAGTLGYVDLEFATKRDICAHACPVCIGASDCTADGSTFAMDEGARVGTRLSDCDGVVLCASTAAKSSNDGVRNLMTMRRECGRCDANTLCS
jgi:hypothetical protein